MSATDLTFDPMFPWPLLTGLAVLIAALIAFSAWRRARGTVLWAVAATVTWLALVNPSLTIAQREPQPDAVIVVVDESPSQQMGNRAERREAALASLRDAMDGLGDVDLRVVRTGGDESRGTALFAALERARSEIPAERLGASVLITDGQVHDIPADPADHETGGPLHVLLTGDKNEADRRLLVESAPSYGLIGKPLKVDVRLDDLGGSPARDVAVTVRRDGVPMTTLRLPTGTTVPIEIEVDHAGLSVFEIEAAPGPEELTLANNRSVFAVNGVRDRLRVLLVSGEPHPGGRAWRNLLRADPGVDLVHFTILRPPEKQDGTPVRELSLISFPVRELFELKLDEFDLVIFDRYRRRGVMPQRYVANIVDYVNNGGALLAAIGPTFAGPMSLYNTPLGNILPVTPTGGLADDPYLPAVTELGRRHPVTAGLSPGDQGADWGHWFRYVEADQARGDTLMTGPADKPLLILDRVGEGRLGLLLSDHIWLWARGYDGGGPQAELVRRMAHWLMKEPELEENRLIAEIDRGVLKITRRTLAANERPVTVTHPDGREDTVALSEDEDGIARGSLPVAGPGLYRLSDGDLSALAAAGVPNPAEYRDVRGTDETLAAITAASGGGLVWLSDGSAPEWRRARPTQDQSGINNFNGRPWLGVRDNRHAVVTGVDTVSLLPGLVVLVVVLGALMGAWRREAG